MGARHNLRARLERGEQLVGPGVYDALSAKLCEQAGLGLAFLSGYALSAVRLGEPDFGLLSLAEVVDATRAITGATHVPLIVDADTGYGNALNVMRTVRELERAGASGLLLEDQLWPKRCGHMTGKSVIPADEFVQKLRAAVDARESPDFIIIARTDARAPLGLDEAIARAALYKEAGADVLFVEAPESEDELRRIGQSLPRPLLANMLEGGRTPRLAHDELLSLGFQIVAHPVTGLYAATHGLRRAFERLQHSNAPLPSESSTVTFTEFHEIIGLQDKLDAERRYASPPPPAGDQEAI